MPRALAQLAGTQLPAGTGRARPSAREALAGAFWCRWAELLLRSTSLFTHSELVPAAGSAALAPASCDSRILSPARPFPLSIPPPREQQSPITAPERRMPETAEQHGVSSAQANATLELPKVRKPPSGSIRAPAPLTVSRRVALGAGEGEEALFVKGIILLRENCSLIGNWSRDGCLAHVYREPLAALLRVF